MYREPLDSYSQWNQTICLFKLRQRKYTNFNTKTRSRLCRLQTTLINKSESSLTGGSCSGLRQRSSEEQNVWFCETRAQEEDLLASAMQTGGHFTCVLKSYFADINLDYGSCNASSLGSAAPPAPSTHLLTSGGRKAPVWTAPSEAPHACRKTRSRL